MGKDRVSRTHGWHPGRPPSRWRISAPKSARARNSMRLFSATCGFQGDTSLATPPRVTRASPDPESVHAPGIHSRLRAFRIRGTAPAWDRKMKWLKKPPGYCRGSWSMPGDVVVLCCPVEGLRAPWTSGWTLRRSEGGFHPRPALGNCRRAGKINAFELPQAQAFTGNAVLTGEC
jgi:hypothetical protein